MSSARRTHQTLGGRRAKVAFTDGERTARTLETRIGNHITPRPDGCWIYGNNPDRYHFDAVVGLVHRYVYEVLVGPIPEGRSLHHTCKVKGCCNPKHLVPLTVAGHAAEHAALRRGRSTL